MEGFWKDTKKRPKPRNPSSRLPEQQPQRIQTIPKIYTNSSPRSNIESSNSCRATSPPHSFIQLELQRVILAALAAVPTTANAIESDVLRLAHVVRPAVGRVA
jgi:hypothetical protein